MEPSNKSEPVEEEPKIVLIHACPHAWHIPLGRHVKVLHVVVEVAFEELCLLSGCCFFLQHTQSQTLRFKHQNKKMQAFFKQLVLPCCLQDHGWGAKAPVAHIGSHDVEPIEVAIR